METKEIVKYHNYFNSVNFSTLKSNELNVIMALLAKMKEKDKKCVTFTYAELKEAMFIRNTTNEELRKTIRAASKKIGEVNGEIQLPDGKIVDFNLFPTRTDDPAAHTFTIRVNEDVLFILNGLTQNFTMFELKEFITLKSKYSKHLYRILKQFRTQGKYAVNANQFRIVMDCPKTYSNKEFQRKVINPALQELNTIFKELECTQIKAKKRGNPIVGYKFTFEAEKPKKKITDEQESVSSVQTFDEYIKAYQGDDKPTPIELKIAKDIAKGNKKKKKVNQFNDFPQDEYDYEELETLLLTTESNGQKML